MGSETLHHLPAVTHPQCDFRWDSHVEGSDPKAHISPHTLLQLWALTGSRGITESPPLPVPISAAAGAPPQPGHEPSWLSEELRPSCGPCMKRIPNPMPAGLMQSWGGLQPQGAAARTGEPGGAAARRPHLSMACGLGRSEPCPQVTGSCATIPLPSQCSNNQNKAQSKCNTLQLSWNHPLSLIHGKTVSHETDPWYQKVGDH